MGGEGRKEGRRGEGKGESITKLPELRREQKGSSHLASRLYLISKEFTHIQKNLACL